MDRKFLKCHRFFFILRTPRYHCHDDFESFPFSLRVDSFRYVSFHFARPFRFPLHAPDQSVLPNRPSAKHVSCERWPSIHTNSYKSKPVSEPRRIIQPGRLDKVWSVAHSTLQRYSSQLLALCLKCFSCWPHLHSASHSLHLKSLIVRTSRQD